MLNSRTLANITAMLPDAITVTLTPFNATIAAITVNGARQRPASRKDIEYAANIGIGLPERIFLLPVTNVAAGYEVVQNDLITDAAEKKWNVLATVLEMQGTIWRCFAKRSP